MFHKYIINNILWMKKDKKWTKDACIELCKGCKTKLELILKNRYVYQLMLQNNWFDEVDWLKKVYNPKKWTKEKVFNECKKYSSRNELEKNNPYVYRVVKNNCWINEITWFKTKASVYLYGYFVYIYKDDKNKVAYVGLTCDKNRRYISHKTGKTYGKNNISPVYNYFVKTLGTNVPEPIYLENNISKDDALEKENFWRYEYEKMGYTMLNKAKTGKHSGSIGGNYIKWTKNKIFEISKNYTNISEFQKKYPQPYKVARLNGWLDEMTWLKRKLNKKGKWQNKENVLEESKKYEYRNDFRINSKGAYESARLNGWLDEMTWLKTHKKPNGYWTKENIFKESKKYKNITEFEKYCSRAVVIARKNKWEKELYKL